MSLSSLRVAIRGIRRQPVFAVVVILSLSLGIALNTTMYGMFDALVHPRIDIRNPEQLFSIHFFGDYHWRIDNRARDAALMRGLHTYESITRVDFTVFGQAFEHGQRFCEGDVARVGPNFFDVVGARPLLGRTFIPSDVTAEETPVVVTDELVARLFRADESPIGAHITLDGQRRLIVGVVSAAANFPHERFSAWEIAPFNARGIYIRLIRLRPGATRADAERELGVVAAGIAAAAGENPRNVAFRLHPAVDEQYQVRDFQIALGLAVAAVLLLACANLANIQLARGIGRRRELALRSALGASRRRIVGHLLTESTLLAGTGLTLGLVMTYWSARLLRGSIPASVGRFIVEPQLSWRVLLFAMAATTFCVVAIGLFPAVTVSRTNPNDLLKSGAGTGSTRRNRRLYGTLVGIEIALALALMSGSAVLVHTWLVFNSFRYTFDPAPVAVAGLSVPLPPGTWRYSELLQSVTNRLGSLHGQADAVAAAKSLGVENNALTVSDPGGEREIPAPLFAATVVTPSYLRTVGLPMLAGRDFMKGERDAASVIVDQATARRLWPNADPVGSLIKLGDRHSNRPFARVVGVVSNMDDRTDANAPTTLAGPRRLGRVYYLPGPADTFRVRPKRLVGMILLARAEKHPEKLPIALRHELGGWSGARISGAMSWDDAYGQGEQRRSQRFIATLFTLFASLGVGLAAFGVYGVVAHSVAERRRELGVRVALGASRGDVLHTVLRESVVVALLGVALGLLMTKYGVVYLTKVVLEDEIFNAPLFAGLAVLLVAVAAASAFVPALRATRIDPTESLRNE